MKRDEILDAVKLTICKDRNDQHGEPETSFPLIASAWTHYLQDFGFMPTDKHLKPSDVAFLMAEFKECRYRINPANSDNKHDQIGYLAIGVELQSQERSTDENPATVLNKVFKDLEESGGSVKVEVTGKQLDQIFKYCEQKIPVLDQGDLTPKELQEQTGVVLPSDIGRCFARPLADIPRKEIKPNERIAVLMPNGNVDVVRFVQGGFELVVRLGNSTSLESAFKLACAGHMKNIGDVASWNKTNRRYFFELKSDGWKLITSHKYSKDSHRVIFDEFPPHPPQAAQGAVIIVRDKTHGYLFEHVWHGGEWREVKFTVYGPN